MTLVERSLSVVREWDGLVTIYKIVNTNNGKTYIGSTIRDPSTRFNEHKSRLNNGKHENILLQKDWNEYGEEAFEFDVLASFPQNERVVQEHRYMKTYNSLNNECGYNLTTPSGHHTKEVRLKISKKVSGERHWNYGNNFTHETIDKMSATRKGRPIFAKGKWPKKVINKLRKVRSENSKGENNSQAKLTESQVIEIYKRYKEGGITQEKLATEYGVSQNRVSQIVRGKSWSHVTSKLKEE